MKIKILAIASSALALSAGPALAADPIMPVAPAAPIVYEPTTAYEWAGFYAGVRAGGQFAGDTNGVVGAFVGYNFDVAPGVIAGAEVDADYVWGDNDFEAWELLASGRVGYLVTDETLVYAKAGIGHRDPSNDGNTEGGMYAFGGGVEFAMSESMTLRGEVLGQGFFGDDAPNDGAPNAAKATIGLGFHF